MSRIISKRVRTLLKCSKPSYSFSPAAGPRIPSPVVIHIKVFVFFLFNLLFEDDKIYYITLALHRKRRIE